VRRIAALAAGLVGLLAGLVLFAASAVAHATLVTATPADASRLTAAPASVSITFDEPVSISYLHVIDPSGDRVEAGTPTHPGGDSTKIAVNLRPGLGDGTYVESWRVVSADSHPVAGTVRFVVGNGPLAASTVDTSTVNRVTNATFDVVRWVSFAGFALLGGVWLLLTVWPAGRVERRARRLVWLGWAALTVGTVAELLMQGPYTAGQGLAGVFNGSSLNATLHASYGEYHSVRLLLLGLLALVLGRAMTAARRESRLELAAGPLLVGIAVTFSMIGHPDTTNPRWLSVPVDVLHLCAMATWVGGLVMLLGAVLPWRGFAGGELPTRDEAELRRVLPTFSRVAFVSVIALASTGTYAAWRGVGSWTALFGTTYGLLVVTKIALFVGLLVVGNYGRRAIQRITRPVVVAYAMSSRLDDVPPEPPPPPPVPAERIRRGVLVEVVLAAAVLAATAVLVSEPRGREALAAEHRKPVTASASLGGGHSVAVTVDPGTHGLVSVSVALSPGTPATSVTGTAALPARQLGPLPLRLTAGGGGTYSASGADLPAAGRWVFTITVSSSAFDSTVTDVTVRLY
jgi:copper transport protein